MEPGEIIALAALIFTVFTFIAGALIRSRDNQIEELRRTRDGHERRIDVLEKTLEAKQETIDEQHRQLDRLIITAEIQERFFGRFAGQLSSSPPRSSTGGSP